MFEQQRSEIGMNSGRVAVILIVAIVCFAFIYFISRQDEWVVAITVLGFAVYAMTSQDASNRRRGKVLSDVAQRLGFESWADRLPDWFPVNRLTLGRYGSISGVFVYKELNSRLLFFDCRFAMGKGSRSGTVVAIEGNDNAFGYEAYGPDRELIVKAGWAVVACRENWLDEVALAEILAAAIAKLPYDQRETEHEQA